MRRPAVNDFASIEAVAEEMIDGAGLNERPPTRPAGRRSERAACYEHEGEQHVEGQPAHSTAPLTHFCVSLMNRDTCRRDERKASSRLQRDLTARQVG